MAKSKTRRVLGCIKVSLDRIVLEHELLSA